MGVGSPFCPTGSFFFFGKRPLFSPESVEEFHLIGSSRPVVVNLRNGERDKRRSVSIGDSNIFGCFSGYSHGLCVLSSGEVNLQTWKELMLLGLISLLLAQSARWISEICVNSSLFSSRFYLCSEKDYVIIENTMLESSLSSTNATYTSRGLLSHQCVEGHEPFVSYEGLEQLHRFLFVLGITHVLYSFLAVGLAMSKIYSWRKWETQDTLVAEGNFQAKKNKVMRRQSTFVFHHTSHPWSRSRFLIWMLCFLWQFRSSIRKSDYLALRLGFVLKHKLPLSYNFHKYMVRSMEDEFNGILGISWPLWGYAIVCIFINIHGLNIYFWLSFIPAILVMLVGTKLQHVVSSLALEIGEQTGPSVAGQVKPRDDLFWFGKPDILLRLIQFIIFQNAFEMATFIWSLYSCPVLV
ncbi:hypothetical protein I3760_05G050800 [Carya illinoinensis]|nr:hypothetical protein I3760_05G050800 [Carya illinoinensis]